MDDYFMLEKPKQCINCCKTENEIQCHPFPQDLGMAREWTKSVGSDANIPISLLQSKYVVCRDHFCEDDYDLKLNFIAGDGTAFETGFRLKSTAVPKPYMDEYKAYAAKTNTKSETTKKESPVKVHPQPTRKSQLTLVMQNLIYGKQQDIEADKENNNEVENENIEQEIISKFNVRSLTDLEIKYSDDITSSLSDSSCTEELSGMSIPKRVTKPDVQPPHRRFSTQPIMNCSDKEILFEMHNNTNNKIPYDIRDNKWKDAYDEKERENVYHEPIGYSEYCKFDDTATASLADAVQSFQFDEHNHESLSIDNINAYGDFNQGQLYKKLCEYVVRIEELEATVQRYQKSHVILSQQVAGMRRELKGLSPSSFL